ASGCPVFGRRTHGWEEAWPRMLLPTRRSPPEREARAGRWEGEGTGDEGEANRGCRRGEDPKIPAPSEENCLPARLGDAGQLAAVRHVTEADTRDAELREDTTGAAVDGVTRTHANRRRVARQLLQADAGGLAGLVGG